MKKRIIILVVSLIIITGIIIGETTSISFKYIEEFCYYLNCTPGDLIKIISDEEYKNLVRESIAKK